jgi:hypothetical protein
METNYVIDFDTVLMEMYYKNEGVEAWEVIKGGKEDNE